MPDLDQHLIRELAGWRTGALPVSSVYVNVDGRLRPRRQDVQQQADILCRRLTEGASAGSRAAERSLEADAARIRSFVEREFERGPTRGLALFSCHGAGLFQDVRMARPVRDRALVGESPYVLPLEAVLEVSRRICVALVDRGRARLIVVSKGRVESEETIADDVPGRHKGGEWAEARLQRHADDRAAKHMKRVADALLELRRNPGIDQLVVAGPGEAPAGLEAVLHDYLRQRVAARWALDMNVATQEVLDRALALEEELETERERLALERVRAAAAAGRGGVLGLDPVLDALNEGRVEMLVAPLDLRRPGFRCTACARLATANGRCRSCGAATEELADVVEAAVAVAYRQRSAIDAISYSRVDAGHEVGALLRY